MNKLIQFVIPKGYDAPADIEALQKAGFAVGETPMSEATALIYHGAPIWRKDDYPKDPRYINTWEKCITMRRLSKYYPIIEDLCIPTFFAKELNEKVAKEIHRRGWKKAFIKNDIKSLKTTNIGSSVWPDTSFETMVQLFMKNFPPTGIFAIRQYIEPQLIDLQEDRYWIINNHIHYRKPHIPNVVKEAVRRLAPIGNMYYTIDATETQITELNAGEGADRYGDNNPPELFASWFAEEFL